MRDRADVPVTRSILDRPRERNAFHQLAELVDRDNRARLARWTMGVSPAAVMGAWMDWSAHFSVLQGKQVELANKALTDAARLGHYALARATGREADPVAEPDPTDRRFRHEGWQALPLDLAKQSFLLAQDWWDSATTEVRGVSRANEREVRFMARQLLDATSPSNLPWLNPEVTERTRREWGANLVRGYWNWLEDLGELMFDGRDRIESKWKVGENLALTPGRVVYRNHLIELIQYEPTTPTVHPEPVLIVPAWIMKYYILDLRPENSLVRYMVGQGHTVFMISWRNPDAGDRDLGMNDYLEQGPLAALEEIARINGPARVHLTGYCLGGTLAAIAAAKLARDGQDRLASLTLFAGQTDFTEAGELMLFMDESEVALLEDMMWKQGYLDAHQISGAFQLLRSNDLIWSRIVRQYLLGERPEPNDLMTWNADSTRMPYRMHSEYLRKMFLGNDLASGRYEVEGRPVFLSDIRVPIFAVGTETDHVAPWRSVYKISRLADADTTFVLTNGGHNAGVVSEPGHPRRHYRMLTHRHGENHLSPDEWEAQAPCFDGSWWPAWHDWLADHSGAPVKPPKMGAPLADAPGTYVFVT
ncbi:PHA/PHB synthase family protein [Jhaorihella thermophila]|uniref:Polyhydroxyalkanoate synthase n=1 Tax=Jhaorihella thermophila TaxID=488547 RepID=A0A1H5SKA8_9RHOB|nr:alpha/beta fold hydrolase [Jhaorihella thermophila]SEF51063.1 polyhydroxyalkanoate synthase [Jhaorihella thermophila]